MPKKNYRNRISPICQQDHDRQTSEKLANMPEKLANMEWRKKGLQKTKKQRRTVQRTPLTNACKTSYAGFSKNSASTCYPYS